MAQISTVLFFYFILTCLTAGNVSVQPTFSFVKSELYTLKQMIQKHPRWQPKEDADSQPPNSLVPGRTSIPPS